jgi:hypothetical protein
MGVRCVLVNLTKKQLVERADDCWKGDVLYCDIHDVMHKYHWKKTDDMYVFGDMYLGKYEYDKKTKKMKIVDVTKSYHALDADHPDNPFAECNKPGPLSELIMDCEPSNCVLMDKNTCSGTVIEKTALHAPTWKNKKCIRCIKEKDLVL